MVDVLIMAVLVLLFYAWLATLYPIDKPDKKEDNDE